MASRCRSCFAGLWICLGVTLAPSPALAAKVYVVYASISGTQAIGWIAKEAGLFAKHGLDVDLLFVGGPSVIAARLTGSDVIITAHVFDTILYSLMIQQGIRTWPISS